MSFERFNEIVSKYSNQIIEYLKKREMVIFTGAGISIPPPASMPSTNKLTQHFIDLLALEKQIAFKKNTNYEFYKILQIAFKELGDRKYIEELELLFNDDGCSPNKLHKLIARLNAKYYLTTNFDRFLDKSLTDLYGESNVAIISEDREINKEKDVNLLHLHGFTSEIDDIVVTHEDLIHRFNKYPMMGHLVALLITRRPVLFLGYSISDINIRPILEIAKHYKPPPWYAVLFNVDEIEKRFLNSLGITILPFEGDESEIESILSSYLFDIWRKMQPFDFYIKPFNTMKQPSNKELLNKALFLDRTGLYIDAEQTLQQLGEMKKLQSYWRINPTEFAQYAYLKLKILDKINCWEKVDDTLKELLKDLDQLSDFYPENLTTCICDQIYWAAALPYLRCGKYSSVENNFLKCLNVLPGIFDENIAIDDVPRFADCHSVLAIVYLNQLYATDDNLIKIKKYQDALSEVELSEKYIKLYKEKAKMPIHYEGRLKGIKLFVYIAGVRKGVLPNEKNLFLPSIQEVEVILSQLVSQQNYDGWIKYGQLSARYCEAAFYIVRAECADDPTEKNNFTEKCINGITEVFSENCRNELVNIAQKPFEKYKFYRLLNFAYMLTNNENKKNETRLMCEKLEGITVKMEMTKYIKEPDWIFTPLN